MKSKDRAKAAEETEVQKAYAKVVRSAELQDIKLLSSSFGVEMAYFEDGEIGHADGEKLNYSYACEQPMVAYEATDGGLLGQFDWKVIVARDDTEVLTIRATYVAAYQCDEGLDEKATTKFVERVGRFATFPYFRALVGFYSNASSIEIPILPVLKE